MLETNELTKKLRTLLHPRAVLIAYSGEQDNSYASDNSYFVEIRDIDDNGMMGEGRPVTVDFMNELGARLFRKPQYHAIRQDSAQYAVVRPAQGKREIYLVQSPAETDDVLQGITPDGEREI